MFPRHHMDLREKIVLKIKPFSLIIRKISRNYNL